jgi:flagellar biosynthesis GTPase FlhF
MAYGKKNVISTDLNKVIFGLLGESGIGKTTTLYHMAETLFGDEGYILLDMGSEYGSEYIEGVVAEPVETFKKFLDIVNDICKNKDKDYPNLKVILADTLDALFEVGEPYLTKLYNQEHMGEKNFVPAKTINAAEGGFMHGQDRLIDIVVEQIVKLRKVGVGFWYTGHVKRRSTDDVFSGDSYDQLTTSMSQRYFNAIKNKTHALGIAYINRDLTEQEIGKENPVTHKKNTITKIVSESRKVKFRDDSYTADSKSRLKYIIDEVNLDEHEIIKALEDAIAEEKKNPYNADAKPATKKKSTKKSEPIDEPVKESFNITDSCVDELPIVEDIFDEAEDEIAEDVVAPVDKDVLAEIRAAFKAADADTKAEVKTILANYGGKLANEMKPSDVKSIQKILKDSDEV